MSQIIQKFLKFYLIISLSVIAFAFEGNAFAIKDPFIELDADGIKEIEIQYIYSDGKISTSTDIESSSIKVYGRQEALDTLKLYKDGDALKLKYNSTVRNNDDNLKVYVEVFAPQQIDLEISVIDGEWSIDNIIGDLKVKSYGDGYFGFHDLDSEEAEFTLNGSGNIDIKGGLIEKFKAKILGSGVITFNGVAEEAEFEIIGSGQLKLNRVLEKISNQTIFGSGKVKIKNLPAESRSHKTKQKIDLKSEELKTEEVQGKKNKS